MLSFRFLHPVAWDVAALIGILSFPIIAHPEPALSHETKSHWRLSAPGEVGISGGYINGVGVRPVEGPVMKFFTDLEPTIKSPGGQFMGSLGVRYDDVETFDFHLPERKIGLHLKTDYDVTKEFSVGLDVFTRWAFRPDWADLYQPIVQGGVPTGEYEPTDRFSYFERGVSLHTAYRFSEQAIVGAEGGVTKNDYTVDPSYNPVTSFTHLTPGDYLRWNTTGSFSGAAWHSFWRYHIDLTYEDWQSANYLARNDKTGGVTSSGGSPNPLQEFQRLHVFWRNSFFFRSLNTRAILGIGYTRNHDVFEDYFTWDQVDVETKLRFRPGYRFLVEAGYDWVFRQYTSSGYQPSGSHPPLDYGDVRSARSHAVNVAVRREFKTLRLTPFIEGSFEDFKTNYPDYQPFVFPSTRAYQIDWDFRNLSVVMGTTYEF